jgi:hypothetical protein
LIAEPLLIKTVDHLWLRVGGELFGEISTARVRNSGTVLPQFLRPLLILLMNLKTISLLPALIF